jgi:hypothetical protein
MNERNCFMLATLALCLAAGACGAADGSVGGGIPVAAGPDTQAYWDNLAAYKGRPRYDYPGPALIGGTGGGP